jgi:dTMP kinase
MLGSFQNCSASPGLTDGAPARIICSHTVNTQHPGFFIVIEGIDGAGKTTQAARIESLLTSHQIRVVRTKEPTDGPHGKLLRESAVSGRLSLEQEVAEFILDRQEHVSQVIVPSLQRGDVVLMDRYYFSSMAYQGARGYDVQTIQARNEAFAPQPDLLVLLDIVPDAGLQRVQKRGSKADLFENNEALRRAREIFLAIDKPYLLKLDARKDSEELTRRILSEFLRRATQRDGTQPQSQVPALRRIQAEF